MLEKFDRCWLLSDDFILSALKTNELYIYSELAVIHVSVQHKLSEHQRIYFSVQ